MKLIINTDGGARGNPGPGAIGIVIKNEQGEKVLEVGRYIGVCTNNDAEYQALIAGLLGAQDKEGTELICYLDSELVVKQLNGAYKVKEARMKEYFKKVKELESEFESVSYIHIERTKNKEADAIVNQVLDSA